MEPSDITTVVQEIVDNEPDKEKEGSSSGSSTSRSYSSSSNSGSESIKSNSPSLKSFNAENHVASHPYDVKDYTDEGKEATEILQERRKQRLRLAVLFWLFLEKFGDTVVVFLLTLLATKWKLLFSALQSSLWLLILLVLFLLITTVLVSRTSLSRQFPGCIVFKFFYLLFLTTLFFILVIHVPHLAPFMRSYFALVTLGTAAGTYFCLACIAVTHEHLFEVKSTGCALWAYGLVAPVTVLTASQPIFLFGGIGEAYDFEYGEYMVNISVGVLASLPFSYETVYIYKRYVNSNCLEDFLSSSVLIPGYVTAYFGKHPEHVVAKQEHYEINHFANNLSKI